MFFVFDENINDFVCSRLLLPVSAPDCDIMWSHSRFVEAQKMLCSHYEELTLMNAFYPLQSPSFSGFSAHYAGLAGDFKLSPQIRDPIPLQKEIRRRCIKSGLFSYIQPQYRTPWWIHAEVGIAPPSSLFVPYPVLFPGNIGPHVFILQKGLCLMGLHCLLSGRFDGLTLNALLSFKQRFSLAPDPWVDAFTWQALFYQIKKAAKPPK